MFCILEDLLCHHAYTNCEHICTWYKFFPMADQNLMNLISFYFFETSLVLFCGLSVMWTYFIYVDVACSFLNQLVPFGAPWTYKMTICHIIITSVDILTLHFFYFLRNKMILHQLIIPFEGSQNWTNL